MLAELLHSESAIGTAQFRQLGMYGGDQCTRFPKTGHDGIDLVFLPSVHAVSTRSVSIIHFMNTLRLPNVHFFVTTMVCWIDTLEVSPCSWGNSAHQEVVVLAERIPVPRPSPGLQCRFQKDLMPITGESGLSQARVQKGQQAAFATLFSWSRLDIPDDHHASPRRSSVDGEFANLSAVPQSAHERG